MERFVRKSAADVAADQLRTAIVFGELGMGAPLSEALIAEKLGTSRTPVREAFRQLAQEGLLVLRPYAGASVFQLSAAEACDLLDFRIILEMAALRMAFARDPSMLAEALTPLVVRMSAMVQSSELREYLGLDSEFHEAIVKASHNPPLGNAYARIASKVAAMRNLIGREPGRLSKSLEGHRALLECIRKNDLEGCTSLLTLHIQNVKHVFNASLPPAARLAVVSSVPH